MDAQASPSRSISDRLRGALNACRGAWSHAARLALDIALPTLCVACREPVDGEGVCAKCWAKLSVHRAAVLPQARHSLCLRSRPRPALALILFFPVAIVAATIVLLDVGTPLLFWQQRIGQGGRRP